MLDVVILLKSIVLPPFSLFLLAVFGWLVMRRYPRLGRGLLIGSLAAFYILSTPFVGATLLHSLEVGDALTLEQPLHGDGAIVVLSAGVRRDAREYGGDTVDPMSLERLRYAARLHRELGLPILVSGGPGDRTGTAMATAMRESLDQDFGISARWLEPRSRNTYENAAFSSRILHGEDIVNVYLVTHAWHMRRAALAFLLADRGSKLNIVPAATGFVSVPTPEPGDFLASADGLRRSYLAIHEALGYLWYRVYYGI